VVAGGGFLGERQGDYVYTHPCTSPGSCFLNEQVSVMSKRLLAGGTNAAPQS